jgi:hypothetical protein
VNAPETANALAGWALVISLIAVGISLIAAGFAGWQAITAHLDRTRPRPAALVMPRAKPGKVRTIHNEGGSAAHAVKLLIWGSPSSALDRREAVWKLKRGKTPERMGEPITGGKVAGSIPAGATVPIEGFGPRGEMFGPPDGTPGVATNLEVLYSPALAYWTDTRGKPQRAWIEIR